MGRRVKGGGEREGVNREGTEVVIKYSHERT